MPQFSDDLFLGPAQTYMGTGIRPYTTTFTGTISTTTLTVTALLQGAPLVVGMYIDGTSVTDGSYITAFGTGTGGTGTYTLSASSTVSSATTITAHTNLPFDNPSPMSLGVGPLGRVYVWDFVPQVKGNANIVAAAITTAANLTLAAGAAVKSVVTQNGTVLQLDLPRAVSVTTGAGSPTSVNITVSGYDYYGQAMSEVIATGTVASTTTNGLKAFYQISNVAASGGSVVTVSVGTADVFGFPVRFIDKSYIVRYGWNNATTDDTSGVLTVAATATATTSTGDVRGTFAPSTAADGIKRAVVTVALPAIAVGPNATRVGALGVTQA
jgi:hypothetical protein